MRILKNKSPARLYLRSGQEAGRRPHPKACSLKYIILVINDLILPCQTLVSYG